MTTCPCMPTISSRHTKIRFCVSFVTYISPVYKSSRRIKRSRSSLCALTHTRIGFSMEGIGPGYLLREVASIHSWLEGMSTGDYPGCPPLPFVTRSSRLLKKSVSVMGRLRLRLRLR